MSSFTIDINMDAKCPECGKAGATQAGICLGCMVKVMDGAPLKSMTAKLCRKRFQATCRAHREGAVQP